MAGKADLQGKTVFVIGGSGGLGQELCKVMAAQGAHITVFARKRHLLDEAQKNIAASRRDSSQRISTVAGDMGVATSARTLITSQPVIPDILYCVAGGVPDDCGYFLDLEPQAFERCMASNYYSCLYPAQAVLKWWTEDDAKSGTPLIPRRRKIVFMNSTATLVPLPGYIAYTGTKAAQRALADTLRLEAMRYSGPKSTYTVQCVFAHNFITPTFLREQKMKPELTKRIEGTSGATLADLEKEIPHASQVAREIVEDVASEDFAVVGRQLIPQLLWANMMGTSPKRGWGIIDSLLAILTIFFVWPINQRDIQKKCFGDALNKQ